MKKLALAIALVLVLIGSVLGGMVAANGATPTLTLTGGSSAPSRVTISGKSWTPAVQVDLYMDTTADDAHYVAFATPDARGSFLASFALGPAILGLHEIIGIQNGTEVHVRFTITNTQQVDDRVGDVLDSIDTEVGNIEGKLDQGVAIIESYTGSVIMEPDEGQGWNFYEIRHVSLTIFVFGTINGGSASVQVRFPYMGTQIFTTITSDGMTTYEFDTSYLRIMGAGAPFRCSWNMTTIRALV